MGNNNTKKSSKNKTSPNKPNPKSLIESNGTETNNQNDNTFGIYMVGGDLSFASNVLTTIQAVSNSSKSFNEDETLLDKQQRDVYLIFGYIRQQYEQINHCYVAVELKSMVLKYHIDELSKISVEINLNETVNNQTNCQFQIFYHLYSEQNSIKHIQYKYAKQLMPYSNAGTRCNLSAVIWVANVSLFDELTIDIQRFKEFIKNRLFTTLNKHEKLSIFVLFTQTEELKKKSMMDSFESYLSDFKFDYISSDRYDEQTLNFVRNQYVENIVNILYGNAYGHWDDWIYSIQIDNYYDVPNVFDMRNVSKIWKHICNTVVNKQNM